MRGDLIYIIGVPIILYLLVMIVRKTRALNQKIREHFEEEAAGSKDPYADMLALAQVEEALQKQKKLQQQSQDCFEDLVIVPNPSGIIAVRNLIASTVSFWALVIL